MTKAFRRHKPKVNRGAQQHATLPGLAGLYVALMRNPHVSRVTPGTIRHGGGGEAWFKYRVESGAIRLEVRCSSAIQTLTVYTERPEDVIAVAEKAFANRGVCSGSPLGRRAPR